MEGEKVKDTLQIYSNLFLFIETVHEIWELKNKTTLRDTEITGTKSFRKLALVYRPKIEIEIGSLTPYMKFEN